MAVYSCAARHPMHQHQDAMRDGSMCITVCLKSCMTSAFLFPLALQVPTIGICRAEQREKACHKLGVPMPMSIYEVGLHIPLLVFASHGCGASVLLVYTSSHSHDLPLTRCSCPTSRPSTHTISSNNSSLQQQLPMPRLVWMAGPHLTS